jgi:hypothetical protein
LGSVASHVRNHAFEGLNELPGGQVTRACLGAVTYRFRRRLLFQLRMKVLGLRAENEAATGASGLPKHHLIQASHHVRSAGTVASKLEGKCSAKCGHKTTNVCACTSAKDLLPPVTSARGPKKRRRSKGQVHWLCGPSRPECFKRHCEGFSSEYA